MRNRLQPKRWRCEVNCRKEGAIGIFCDRHYVTVTAASREEAVGKLIESCRASGKEPGFAYLVREVRP